MIPHHVTLRGERVTLRPFTDDDVALAIGWYRDPEIRFATEGSAAELDDAYIHRMYETLGSSYLFAIDVANATIGECCLQGMNIERIADRYPDEKVCRLPILVGDKRAWGHGYATEAVRLVLEYAFVVQGVDRFIIPDVASTNLRSRALWLRCGFREIESPGSAGARSIAEGRCGATIVRDGAVEYELEAPERKR